MVSDSSDDSTEETDNLSHPSYEVGRKRGILTQNDREYLLGKHEPEGQDRRNTRYRIRQRVIQGLLDLRLIAERLEVEDMRRIANDERVADDYVRASGITMANELLRLNDGTVDPVGELENLVEYVLQRNPPERPELDQEGYRPLINTHASASITFNYEKATLEDALPEAFEDLSIEESAELILNALEDVSSRDMSYEYDHESETIRIVEDE